MKAIAHTRACALDAPDSLVELDLPAPTPGPRDLLVDVRGVSLNPVDVKVRALMEPDHGHRVLGYDAAGVVTAVGADVTLFSPGDEVFYAGDLTRPGSNAERQLVDERIAGRKPSSLGFAEAAGLPLTSITAWEILFDSFQLQRDQGAGDALLVIGGAGGVGSILIQLAKKLTGLNVIASASRPETKAWVESMGADHVVNHRNPLDEELAAIGIAPRYVASLTNTADHFSAIASLLAPRGHIALIDDPPSLDILPLKSKAITVSWEFMFTRPMFQTPDMDKQHQLLQSVATLLDDGILRSTVNKHLGPMNLDSVRKGHELQESGASIGKTVLDGFAT